MFSRSAILPAIFGAPYAYLAYYWYSCFSANCLLDGDMILMTGIAIVALPVVLIILGTRLLVGGTRSLKHAAREGTASDAVRGGVGFSLGLKMVLAGVPACAVLIYLALDTPLPGRDRLGRICEETSRGTHCRPDPGANHPSELERINAMRRRQKAD